MNTPQLGIHQRHYTLHEVAPYINWLYFFHAWGFAPKYATIASIHGCDACRAQWLASFKEEERAKAAEAMQLWKEAQRLLNVLDADYKTHAVVLLTHCNSNGNDLVLHLADRDFILPLLRQQSGTPPFLCLSDFVRPMDKGDDIIGVFATTVSEEMEHCNDADEYKRLLTQTLADRLAEATAEILHQEVRKYLWGYAANEDLTHEQLCNEEFQGIRPAVGYPSLPDISINRLLNELIDMENLGIHLTENAMMQPHASVSGLMLSHPESKYFLVGKIGNDQFEDYAKRRDMTMEEMKPFLLSNL